MLFSTDNLIGFCRLVVGVLFGGGLGFHGDIWFQGPGLKNGSYRHYKTRC